MFHRKTDLGFFLKGFYFCVTLIKVSHGSQQVRLGLGCF